MNFIVVENVISEGVFRLWQIIPFVLMGSYALVHRKFSWTIKSIVWDSHYFPQDTDSETKASQW